MPAPETGVDEAAFREYLKSPLAFPPAFKDWMSDWYATNVPKLHVSQIFGFKLHSFYVADDVATNEAVSSSAYGDLATAGPTLSHLANGFYIVFFGASMSWSLTQGIYMGISLDGDTPSGQREMLGQSAAVGPTSVGRVALVDMSQGNNDHTLAAKYKYATGVGATAQFRWLHALRVVSDDA